MKIGLKHIHKDVKSKEQHVKQIIMSFLDDFDIVEKEHITVHTDNLTKAFYIECHLTASDIVKKGTIDVPLDPENQPEYRANREVLEKNPAYLKMIDDAKNKRTFSSIVAEYNPNFEPKKPIKIIGGQHRFLAIEQAFNQGIDEAHGFKLYFDLDMQQRLDVQLISNTNIAVASDLLDRMFETVKGSELRDWCHSCGILEPNEDFTDKKQRGSQISVRGARTLIISYVLGKKIKDSEFNNQRTIPLIAATGGIDDLWLEIRAAKGLWKDKKLIKMGKEYALLVKAQKDYFKKKENFEFSEKATSYAVMAAWAFIAGVLHKNEIRLERHYELKSKTNTDPLNALALAKGRHKTDAENYRGLGTRTDTKERGRLAELFFVQGEKGIGITKKIIEFAIEKYHAKEAMLKVRDMANKL